MKIHFESQILTIVKNLYAGIVFQFSTQTVSSQHISPQLRFHYRKIEIAMKEHIHMVGMTNYQVDLRHRPMPRDPKKEEALKKLIARSFTSQTRWATFQEQPSTTTLLIVGKSSC